jgi:hypothetical protein
VSGRHPPLTTDRRLGSGPVLRHGHSAAYRAIEIGAGEPHLIRDDLGTSGLREARPGRALLALVHITDLQLADVQSPTRFEFLNAGFADPRYAGIIPVQRPQEALTAHAVDATLRTLGGVQGPATGMPLQLAVTTGDAIDNAQWNELQAFLALFDGGLVNPDSGVTCRAGRARSSGGRTARVPTGRTFSGASSASRTTPACSSARCASSPRPA